VNFPIDGGESAEMLGEDDADHNDIPETNENE
jgi:hypothetical protein